MNTDAPKTFTTAYNAKRAAGAFLIANRMDPATKVEVIKLFDKAYTYSLPLDAAPAGVAADHKPSRDVVAAATTSALAQVDRSDALAEDLEQAQFAAIRGAKLTTPAPDHVQDALGFAGPIVMVPGLKPHASDDKPLRVPNAEEAATVAALEAAAQAKAAKRKGRRPFEEVVAARLASTEQPAPQRANKAKQPRKQREPKAADAPAVPRVKRADGLTEGSAMAKLVDYAAAEPRTNAELCAHVGWAQCLPMLRKGAEKTGRRFSTTKVQGQPTRYQLVAADAA